MENDKNVLGYLVDITEHWAESSILNAIKQGIVSGYPDGMFYPDNQVTAQNF
ncbi:S-layer homology domain-containing protein [Paenibacillus amylolyticus]|uniref:S-layer homology domain-containing protein n=1 Tax=Paenibacillus TaxID=44249 RepID=UPI0009FB9087